ncbi:MAG: ABC transporter ATP-binding protein [Acidobacteria bacterium]|nr:MAG: ABC transporter ATP-binding protein [Acidobacteriota bacterium]
MRFAGVEKSFGTNRVLTGVDLDVLLGETLVVLGGSGSGKSVLLRHAIGLIRPDAGEVYVDGTRVSDLDEEELVEVRKRVGMLFQGGALFDSMNVFENVAFSLREHTDLPEEEIRERVREKLALVELEGVEEKMPSELSGGMKKRVALARSIALEPQGILYDEPTTGLDPITAMSVNELIRSMQRQLRVTSVVVTHDIQSARVIGDRIAFLCDGRINFVGDFESARRSGEERLLAFLAGGGVSRE